MSMINTGQSPPKPSSARDISCRQANDDEELSKRDVRAILGVVFVGLVALFIIAWLLLPLSAKILPFVVLSAWPLLTLIVVTYQAVVYRRQWRAMRETVWLTEQSLQVANRAYVSVHSFREDFKNDTVFMMLENIGNIPAKSVKVMGNIWIVRHRGTGLGSLGQVDSTSCPFSYEFGKTWLARGNLKAQVIISLFHITLEDKTWIPSVVDGSGTLWITGRIEYEDGFDFGTTEFAFIYLDGEWMVRGIDKTEQREDGEQAKAEKENPN